ncbi:FkbM family methyltransferase [Tautonia plasticadhaerens]|uniref:Methyltransferase FkbM domain-containing protein n=1 Tax=Tautonia plasticadhaerens TaxID=2527974 RepID=A0A518GVD0_9BACT|nr:FkbM family methyltransferase [Tautonia plasticadhaerens]QDV32543.1 hypothetical protein ElP_03770 [Tautonia plasticadhaerens]
MPMISYAQNAEDVLLRRLFPEGSDGFYIDVGASDPIHHSVTKHFYDRGWRGVNIEPIPQMHRALCANRPRDVNLNLAVSDRDGDLTFYQAPGVFSWSASKQLLVEAFHADPGQVIASEIPVATLASLCERHVGGTRTIDFLKIDAEGHEAEVVRGADWGRWRPRAVVIEGAHRPWEATLLAGRYHHAKFDGINHYYIRDEDRDLIPRLASPANVTDDFLYYEHLDREVTLRLDRDATRTQLDEVHGLLYESRQEAGRLSRELDESRRECHALRLRLARFDDLGPTALGVARRLRRISARHRGLARLMRPVLVGAAEVDGGHRIPTGKGT